MCRIQIVIHALSTIQRIAHCFKWIANVWSVWYQFSFKYPFGEFSHFKTKQKPPPKKTTNPPKKPNNNKKQQNPTKKNPNNKASKNKTNKTCHFWNEGQSDLLASRHTFASCTVNYIKGVDGNIYSSGYVYHCCVYLWKRILWFVIKDFGRRSHTNEMWLFGRTKKENQYTVQKIMQM